MTNIYVEYISTSHYTHCRASCKQSGRFSKGKIQWWSNYRRRLGRSSNSKSVVESPPLMFARPWTAIELSSPVYSVECMQAGMRFSSSRGPLCVASGAASEARLRVTRFCPHAQSENAGFNTGKGEKLSKLQPGWADGFCLVSHLFLRPHPVYPNMACVSLRVKKVVIASVGKNVNRCFLSEMWAEKVASISERNGFSRDRCRRRPRPRLAKGTF